MSLNTLFFFLPKLKTHCLLEQRKELIYIKPKEPVLNFKVIYIAQTNKNNKKSLRTDIP